MNYTNKIAKKILLIVVFLIILLNENVYSQLIVTPAAVPPQQLVQNILCGTGVSVTNVTFNGSATGKSGGVYWNNFGSFTTGSTPTNLGFNSGLILASGGVAGAVGPNNSTMYTMAVVPSTPDMSDPDLLTLVPSGTTLHDAAILEFDFIPLSDTIKFRYVFGSEEYPEFVGEFDDVFGFFISGLNPSGPSYVKQNIALIREQQLQYQ